MSLQYVCSDGNGVEFYVDLHTREIVVRDSRISEDPVRECRVSWAELQSKVKDVLGHE